MIRLSFLDVHPGCLMETRLGRGSKGRAGNQWEVIAVVQGEKRVA